MYMISLKNTWKPKVVLAQVFSLSKFSFTNI